MSKLTAKKVQSLIRNGVVGRHSDDSRQFGNLNLVIRADRRNPRWLFRYTLKGVGRKEYIFGDPSNMSLHEARAKAETFRLMVADGIDPRLGDKRQIYDGVRTVDQLFDDWYQNDVLRRIKTHTIPLRIYRKDIKPAIGTMPIDRVLPRDIRSLTQSIASSGRPTVANDALRYCKQLFNYGVKFHDLTANPALPLSIKDAGGAEQQRERFLTVKEIAKVAEVFRENIASFRRDNYLCFCILLCLGVRKGELICAQWSEFDLNKAVWHLPKERIKSTQSLSIPLAPLVVGWLKELEQRRKRFCFKRAFRTQADLSEANSPII